MRRTLTIHAGPTQGHMIEILVLNGLLPQWTASSTDRLYALSSKRPAGLHAIQTENTICDAIECLSSFRACHGRNLAEIGCLNYLQTI